MMPTAGRSSTRIPGPGTTASLRLLNSFFDNPITFFTTLHERWGDIVHVRAGSISMVCVYDLDALQRVLIADAQAMRKGSGIRATRRVLGDGLFTSDGDTHRQDRRIAQPAFQPRNITAYAPTIIRHTDHTMATWSDGTELNIHHAMIGTSLRIVAETILGAQLDEREIHNFAAATDSFNRAYRLMVSPGANLIMRAPLPVVRRFNAGVRYVDELVGRLIAECRSGKHPDRSDLLASMAAATDEDGSRFSDLQLRDHAVTMLAAGHETVAASLAWTCAVLALNTPVQEQLASEVDAVIGSADPTADHMRDMPYLRAVVQEAMRLYPSVYSFVREPLASYELLGHTITPGTDIAAPISAIHRDPRHYEQPLEFRPDRWLDTGGSSRHKLAYMPFGVGPRICIGSSYAMLEIMLVVARIMQQWTLTAPNPTQALDPEAMFTMHPRSGPILTPVSRRA